MTSSIQRFVGAEVDTKLQCNDHVVLHTTNFTAQGYTLLSETIDCSFKLKRVYAHLFFNASSSALWVSTY